MGDSCDVCSAVVAMSVCVDLENSCPCGVEGGGRVNDNLNTLSVTPQTAFSGLSCLTSLSDRVSSRIISRMI